MSAILGLLSDRKLGSLDFQGLYAGNNSNRILPFMKGRAPAARIAVHPVYMANMYDAAAAAPLRNVERKIRRRVAL
jgi:hypothetical protein